MSFNNNARKVRNPALPMHTRWWALHSCISELSFYILPRFSELQAKYMPWPDKNPPEAELLASLAEVERRHKAYLARQLALQMQRREEKKRGQRHPRKADVEAVFREDTNDAEGEI